MSVKRTPKGETARRIYSVLKRNPDLTAYEVHKHLPDLTYAAVCCAITSMQKQGTVESRGKRMILREGGKNPHPCNTYHVKYKSRAKAEPKRKLKTQVKPVVKQVTPKVEKPKTVPMVTLSDDLLRHLGNISKTLQDLNHNNHQIISNNKQLLDLLSGTLEDLAETKRDLHEAQTQRGWWTKTKEWFA